MALPAGDFLIAGRALAYGCASAPSIKVSTNAALWLRQPRSDPAWRSKRAAARVTVTPGGMRSARKPFAFVAHLLAFVHAPFT
jgi:hypothetical protein